MLLAFAVALCSLAVLAGLTALAWQYFGGREELQRMRDLFSRYVPEHVVKEIVARRNPMTLWGERHYATVLSCRIRNFGFFAEELSAEQTLRHLNEFYAVAGRAIVRHNGVIERLTADGITAVFGVLTSDVFQEERALRAALRIVRLANAMNTRWQAQGRRPFAVYVGVNSGRVVAGEVGFAQRREFAIVGNPAHVAARLQQAAEDLNASILATAATYEAVRELFVGVPISTLPLAGLKRLQRAYIVRGLARRNQEELLHLPAEISALETVLPPEAPTKDPERAPAAAAGEAGSGESRATLARFSQYDDIVAAMPELPAVSGIYEPPPARG